MATSIGGPPTGTSQAPPQETGAAPGIATEAEEASPKGIIATIEDQFGVRKLIQEYLIPIETNNIWYTLGGVLAIALILEILTGMALATIYTPDGNVAYQTTADLIAGKRGFVWMVTLNFHYWNAFLIFALVMVHMLRVFISGGYRRGKQGLWLVGVALAGLVFLASLTGEAIHWDETGYAVPWHISEFFQALVPISIFGWHPFGDIVNLFAYSFKDLKTPATATTKLIQLYGVHVAIAPLLLAAFIGLHYYLIKVKGISTPFWIKPSGFKGPFTDHVKAWAFYGVLILGAVLVLAIFVIRDPGTMPQYLPGSPLYGYAHGPGAAGYKPSFPISWTHGMNVFVGEHLEAVGLPNIDPDIWGTVIGMTLMALSLLAIPFLDPGKREPTDFKQAFSRRRILAFGAMGLFWLVMIIGVVTNALAGAG
jgi:ubiquinol-cytochrome c reductase cytochrome b subunit